MRLRKETIDLLYSEKGHEVYVRMSVPEGIRYHIMAVTIGDILGIQQTWYEFDRSKLEERLNRAVSAFLEVMDA